MNSFTGSQNESISTTAAHPRNLPVGEALRTCCQIDVKDFALIIVSPNDRYKVYTSPSLTPHGDRIFSQQYRRDFLELVRASDQQAASGLDISSSILPSPLTSDLASGTRDFSRRVRQGKSKPIEAKFKFSSAASSSSEHKSPVWRRRLRPLESDDSDAGRKRIKAKDTWTSIDDIPAAVRQTQQIRVDDNEKINAFYTTRFKDLQQNACRILAKAWIKLVEPRKQSNHPYCGKEKGRPEWWPETEGDSFVPHKEPDHLHKTPRVILLVHILNLLVEREDEQHQAIKHLKLNIEQLERVTMDCLSTWFKNSERPKNAEKRPFLREIFKVAKMQERFKHDELDDDTLIPVSAHETSGYESSDEGDKDQTSDVKHEAIEVIKPHTAAAKHLHQRYSQTEMDVGSPYNEEQSYFGPDIGMGYHSQPPSALIHLSNRPSYASPTFSHAQQSMRDWHGMVNHGSVMAPYYTTTAPSSMLPMAHQHQYQPLPMPTSLPTALPPLVPSFDGIPSSSPQEIQPAFEPGRGSSILYTHPVAHNQHLFQPWVGGHAGYGGDMDVHMNH